MKGSSANMVVPNNDLNGDAHKLKRERDKCRGALSIYVT